MAIYLRITHLMSSAMEYKIDYLVKIADSRPPTDQDPDHLTDQATQGIIPIRTPTHMDITALLPVIMPAGI